MAILFPFLSIIWDLCVIEVIFPILEILIPVNLAILLIILDLDELAVNKIW